MSPCHPTMRAPLLLTAVLALWLMETEGRPQLRRSRRSLWGSNQLGGYQNPYFMDDDNDVFGDSDDLLTNYARLQSLSGNRGGGGDYYGNGGNNGGYHSNGGYNSNNGGYNSNNGGYNSNGGYNNNNGGYGGFGNLMNMMSWGEDNDDDSLRNLGLLGNLFGGNNNQGGRNRGNQGRQNQGFVSRTNRGSFGRSKGGLFSGANRGMVSGHKSGLVGGTNRGLGNNDS